MDSGRPSLDAGGIWWLVCLLNDGTNREGDFDAFLPESGGQGFDEFVFQAELVIEAGGVQEHVEVDAGLAKVVETDDGLTVSIQFFIEVGEHLTGHFERYIFDFLQVAVIGHTYGNFDDDIVAGHAVVRDDGGGNFLVRNDDHIAIADGNDGGETPGDVGDSAFFAGA